MGVTRLGPGHFDLVHLMLERHEIIYAEGIPAESLLVTPETRIGIGDGLACDLPPDAAVLPHRAARAPEGAAATVR